MKITLLFLIILVLISCRTKDKSILISLRKLKSEKVYFDLDNLPKKLDQIYRLDLSERSLTKIPEIVYKMSNLQELNISGNKISEINKIDRLSNLQVLNISMNSFLIFPGNVSHLRHLKVLDIYRNDILTFPDSFYNNESIESLDMTSMFKFDFTTNLSKIHRLKNLKKLYLGNNQIEKLNIKFSEMKNLNVFSFIGQDKIDVKKILLCLSSCSSLKIIHLSRNNINSLPKEIVFLENLEELNLFDNKITGLPTTIINLKKLKEICLIDNPVDTIMIGFIKKKMTNTSIFY